MPKSIVKQPFSEKPSFSSPFFEIFLFCLFLFAENPIFAKSWGFQCTYSHSSMKGYRDQAATYTITYKDCSTLKEVVGTILFRGMVSGLCPSTTKIIAEAEYLEGMANLERYDGFWDNLLNTVTATATLGAIYSYLGKDDEGKSTKIGGTTYENVTLKKNLKNTGTYAYIGHAHFMDEDKNKLFPDEWVWVLKGGDTLSKDQTPTQGQILWFDDPTVLPPL